MSRIENCNMIDFAAIIKQIFECGVCACSVCNIAHRVEPVLCEECGAKPECLER